MAIFITLRIDYLSVNSFEPLTFVCERENLTLHCHWSFLQKVDTTRNSISSDYFCGHLYNMGIYLSSIN